MSFFTYVISNPENRYYIGQTSDLDRRVAEHNDRYNKNSKFTKRYTGPWGLIHSEEFSTRSEAMKREKQLKTNRGRQWLRDTFNLNKE